MTLDARDACAGQGAGRSACKGAGRPPPPRRRLPPLHGGALRCSQHRLARRNSLRSLRELRSDNRRENDGRCALRAPPVLLRFSAAHRRGGVGRPAPLPAASRRSRRTSPASIRIPRASPSRQAAADWAPGIRSAPGARGAGRRAAAGAWAGPGEGLAAPCGGARPGGVLSAAPSSAASGSAREARFVPLTRGDCPSGAREASVASFAARPRGEQRREVGAQHRPPRPAPRQALPHRMAQRAPRPALPRRLPRPCGRRPERPARSECLGRSPLPPAATRQS